MSDEAPQLPTHKRKVDDRIKFLVEEAARLKHRGIVLLVGDRAKDQIVNLHHLVSRANHSSKVSMLWCMKQDVDFGSTGKKRQERVARLEVKGGMSTEASKEAFQTFLQQTTIRFCQYKETHRVLGQTFGMAVLQDFEALTPNTLARTMETVAGGGLIVIMLRAMRSLKQLYTIAMDVHSRYRTDAHRDVVPRFNERFLLSLMDCNLALCLDDDLNVLPFTTKMKNLGSSATHDKLDATLAIQGRLQHELDLATLKDRLKVSKDVGPLVALTQTIDQAKTVLSLMQSVTEKTLNTTCAITAGRGRGKSTALGIAVAGAIDQGYSNIFATAPTPENLQTFFEFVVKGLLELGYKERVDFEAMQSTNPEFAKCIIRVNVFRGHRQTVQYIAPQDSQRFSQAELLVIDEAAAIPLPIVKKMLGNYLVFFATTISGYEGTGRALSMKLVADMRKKGAAGATATDARSLRELSLQDPIRYGPSDPVEAWLNKLLCLEATSTKVPTSACPHPSTCELYYVNRDALFSYHPSAEKMLHTLVSLLVAAHYKNQPNDLQLMSDAPGHHLFVLCGPLANGSDIPEIYCVIHACEEGNIASSTMQSNMAKGLRPSGDMIPYTMAQYFLEDGFGKLGGLRVVRIATNPDLQRSGYGSRALSLLKEYYKGNIAIDSTGNAEDAAVAAPSRSAEVEGDVAPRAKIPALLTPLHERPFEPLDYIGVSFGATNELFNFWKKAGFEMMYLRQVPNDTTGEHSCIMVHPIDYDATELRREFRHRFLALLSQSFRDLPIDLSLAIAMDLDAHIPQSLAKATTTDPATGSTLVDGVPQSSFQDLVDQFSVPDLKRLQLCSTAYVDNSVVWDLIPKVARMYFEKKCFKNVDGTEGVVLAHAQAAVLLAVGLQCKSVEALVDSATFAGVPAQQLRAFLNKGLSRIVEHFQKLQNEAKKTVVAEATAKRAREENEEDGADEEETVERFDAQGNLIGLSVSRKAEKRAVDVDSTLRRDTRNAVFTATSEASSGARRSAGAGKMKMSKKTRGKQ